MRNNLPLCCHNGSIAILTLWAVLFLSVFATAMGGQVVAGYQAADRLRRVVLSDAIAGRAFEDALSVIRDDKTEGYDSLNDPWADDSSRFKNVSFDGAYYSLISEGTRYGLTDEMGEININHAPADVISKLFQIVGQMSPSDAWETAAYLVDWRDADAKKEGGGENEVEECAKFSKPYSCKNATIEAVEELWWLPNMTRQVFDRILGKVTLYGPGQININTAGVDVLRCLGLSYGAAAVVVNSRKMRPFEQISELVGNFEKFGMGGEDLAVMKLLVSKGLVGVRSDVYQGQLVVDFGGRLKKNISFIVNRNGELKSWNE